MAGCTGIQALSVKRKSNNPAIPTVCFYSPTIPAPSVRSIHAVIMSRALR